MTTRFIPHTHSLIGVRRGVEPAEEVTGGDEPHLHHPNYAPVPGSLMTHHLRLAMQDNHVAGSCPPPDFLLTAKGSSLALPAHLKDLFVLFHGYWYDFMHGGKNVRETRVVSWPLSLHGDTMKLTLPVLELPVPIDDQTLRVLQVHLLHGSPLPMMDVLYSMGAAAVANDPCQFTEFVFRYVKDLVRLSLARSQRNMVLFEYIRKLLSQFAFFAHDEPILDCAGASLLELVALCAEHRGHDFDDEVNLVLAMGYLQRYKHMRDVSHVLDGAHGHELLDVVRGSVANAVLHFLDEEENADRAGPLLFLWDYAAQAGTENTKTARRVLQYLQKKYKGPAAPRRDQVRRATLELSQFLAKIQVEHLRAHGRALRSVHSVARELRDAHE